MFPGWKILDKNSNDNKSYEYLISLKQNSEIAYNKIIAKMTLKNLKSHISEAKLVQLLEEKGIGRPSTFSSLVDKIELNYVKLQDIEGKKIECKNFQVIGKNIDIIKQEKVFGNENKKL